MTDSNAGSILIFLNYLPCVTAKDIVVTETKERPDSLNTIYFAKSMIIQIICFYGILVFA
jgi:hypothetical protein